MNNPDHEYRCPTCNRRFIGSEPTARRPFCSERCRLIDLGEWLDENYRISPHAPDPHPYLPAEQDDETH